MELKKLRCEMCGGNDLVKQNNFFECQYCGTKYTTEEDMVKRMEHKEKYPLLLMII